MNERLHMMVDRIDTLSACYIVNVSSHKQCRTVDKVFEESQTWVLRGRDLDVTNWGCTKFSGSSIEIYCGK